VEVHDRSRSIAGKQSDERLNEEIGDDEARTRTAALLELTRRHGYPSIPSCP